VQDAARNVGCVDHLALRFRLRPGGGGREQQHCADYRAA
jgi:hypothetical protein